MKNILLYGVSSQFGGVETFIFNLIKNLDKNQYQLFLLVNADNYTSKDWLSKQDIIIIKGPNRRRNLLKYKKNLKKILLEYRIDIVWSNLTSLSDVNLLLAAKEVGIKQRIVYAHQSENMGSKLTGLLHEFNKKYRLRKAATDFWACSDKAWEYFYKGIKEFDVSDVFVNAVNPDEYVFNEDVRIRKRKELQLNNSFIIGTVGRLTKEKNQKFILKVVKELKVRIPDIKCLIIGSGPKEGELNQQIIDNQLSENVILLGQRSDVGGLLNTFDIFVLPSIFEGLPFVLVEAQMNGLDVLVSDSVSRESGFTDRIKFLPLDVPKWTNQILSIKNGFIRNSVEKNLVETSKFNIKNNIKEFEKRLKKVY